MQYTEREFHKCVDEALQGQIAGLDVVANSGNAGAGTTMRLRGTSTLNGNAQPLIVVNDHIFELPDDAMQGVDFSNMDNEEQFSTLLNLLLTQTNYGE